jgi:lysophospholipase L1-like esterase
MSAFSKTSFQWTIGAALVASSVHCSASHDTGSEVGADTDAQPGVDASTHVDSDASSDADIAIEPDAEQEASVSDAGTSGAVTDGEAPDAKADAAVPLYHPCPPAGTKCVIMPVGDSITAGYQSTTGGGYRLELLHDIWTNGHDATFVGDNSGGPNTLDGKPFPKSNEGYSGYTIDPAPAVNRSGISPLVPTALKKYPTHIVTLMIGTNDIGTNNDLANAPTRLGNLIDAITTAAPNALLVVAQITPTGSDSSNKLTMTFNAAIPGLVKSRVATGKHIIVVDMYSTFTADASYRTDLMYDSLHPNDKGYSLMGDTWYAAIAPHL